MNAVGRKILRMSWSVIVILVGSFLGLALILTVFQSRLVYFPDRAIAATPDLIGLSYESVSFETSDGVKLSGWFVPAEERRGVVLFCHGNAGNISHRLESIEVFHRLRLSVFIFDYRGYGKSQGRVSEKGTYLDAEAAWRYLLDERQIDPGEIVIFGRSLGGAVGSWLAQDHTPRALVVESTFTSISDIAAQLYPFLPVRRLARFRYSAVDYVGRVNCPVLIVHSRDDEMIPFTHGRRLFEAANEPKEFLEIRGSHNEGFITSAKLYGDGLDAFMSKHAGG